MNSNTCRRPLATLLSFLVFVVVVQLLYHGHVAIRGAENGQGKKKVEDGKRDRALDTTSHVVAEESPSYPTTQQRTSADPHSSTDTSYSLDTTIKVAVIVQLSGEFGNHLSKLAAGLGVALELSRYNVTADLKLRHQDRSDKWTRVVPDLKRCVPSTAQLNFSEAQDFDPSNTFEINDANSDIARGSMRAAVEKAQKGDTNLTLYSNHFTNWDYYMDSYYDQFRNYFRFDDACCRESAFANETVFHYRQFLTEMPRQGARKGFEEITSTDLLSQICMPYNITSIAILSRFKNSVLNEYAETLRHAGLSVRLIVNQTAMEDFCFLKSAKRHMIGSAQSTFFGWAALLSDSAIVTAYSIDSPTRRMYAENNEKPLWTHYNWTNPKLAERVFFPLIKKSTSTFNGTDDYKL